jgi:hypothetical protein|tara:strand:+ start:5057 stop:5410 length:354 start_codon:yes stop_codon:yes gene_type:complete
MHKNSYDEFGEGYFPDTDSDASDDSGKDISEQKAFEIEARNYLICDRFCEDFTAQWPFLKYVRKVGLVECIREDHESILHHSTSEVVKCFCEVTNFKTRSDLAAVVFNAALRYYIGK